MKQFDVLASIALLLILPNAFGVQASPCACGGNGNFYAPVSSEGCMKFIQYSDPANPTGVEQPCSTGLIFDVITCACNYPAQTTCPLGCPSSDCPLDYLKNPYTNTCFRRVTMPLTWDDAAAFCQEAGEELAVFDTVESVEWFDNIRHSRQTWNMAPLWIGARRDLSDDGIFKWFGRLASTSQSDSRVGGLVGTTMNVANWEPGMPRGPRNCVISFGRGRSEEGNALVQNYQWGNADCATMRRFVCELEPGSQPESVLRELRRMSQERVANELALRGVTEEPSNTDGVTEQ